MPKSQGTATLQNAPAPFSRSAVEVLAETTCGCLQVRPGRAGRRRRARGRTSPQKFPSSPTNHFARDRGASQEAQRPLAGSLSAGSPLLPPSIPPSSRLLPLHGCRTEPLNSHRSPPPPARRAGGTPAPAGAPGRADRRPPSNSPRRRFPALAMQSQPPGAPRPPDPPRQPRCRRDRDPRRRCPSPAREATHLCAPPALRTSRTWRGAAVLASSSAATDAVRRSLCSRAARAARLSESRGGAAPAGVGQSGGSARAGNSSPRRASALLAPRLPRRGCQPRAPRPAPALPAPPARGAHWAKGPGCLRSPLPRARPLLGAPSPPCHTCTCCVSTSWSAQLNFYFDSNCGVGRRCAGGAQDPRRRRAAVRTRRGGGVGGRAEPPSAQGFFLSFLFSVCLLQDLKGQPRPKRGARRWPFLRSPDALCGPARPARTRSTGSRPPGIFRSTPGLGQR